MLVAATAVRSRRTTTDRWTPSLPTTSCTPSCDKVTADWRPVLRADAAAAAEVRVPACRRRGPATRGSVTPSVCRAGRDGSVRRPAAARPGGEAAGCRGTTAPYRPSAGCRGRRGGGRGQAASSGASPSAAEAGAVAASWTVPRRRRRQHRLVAADSGRLRARDGPARDAGGGGGAKWEAGGSSSLSEVDRRGRVTRRPGSDPCRRCRLNPAVR